MVKAFLISCKLKFFPSKYIILVSPASEVISLPFIIPNFESLSVDSYSGIFTLPEIHCVISKIGIPFLDIDFKVSIKSSLVGVLPLP